MDNPCYPIAQVVPHQGAMLLLDEILRWDDTYLCASTHILPAMPMADGHGLPAWAGLELMAQATAALAGCRARRQGLPVQPGFLVGTRRYSANCNYFPLGARLEIQVRQGLSGGNGLQVFDCALAGTGIHANISAHAGINIFQPDNPQQFIQDNRR